VFALQSLPMTFIAIKMYNSMPTKTVLSISVLLQMIGAWFRMLAFHYDKFWPVLVGTSIQSLSATFIVSA
jgi:hypothetical protein